MKPIAQPGTRKIFIGDIHGQFSKLNSLLENICKDTENTPAELIFIGDLIDNQASTDIDHQAVLSTVKKLTESGRAVCLMGNHEFNAVGWAMRHPESGRPLRSHTENNHRQHRAFLDDVVETSSAHHAWIEWFKSLPLFIDFEGIRAVHACWDEQAIERLRPWLDDKNRLKPENWVHAFDKQHEVYHLVEKLLKGPELTLPAGYSFLDKTGIERREIRVRWWQREAKTYRHIAQVQPDVVDSIPDIPLSQPYPVLCANPVVIGHYTLAGEPELLSDTVICVDYNAAKGNNPLVAWEYTDNASGISAGRFILSSD